MLAIFLFVICAMLLVAGFESNGSTTAGGEQSHVYDAEFIEID